MIRHVTFGYLYDELLLYNRVTEVPVVSWHRQGSATAEIARDADWRTVKRPFKVTQGHSLFNQSIMTLIQLGWQTATNETE